MIRWQYYPKSKRPDELVLAVVGVFEEALRAVDSAKHKLDSNGVLSKVAPGFARLGFRVETGKAKADKVPVPVLYGRNGQAEKSFEADAYHEATGFVVEVEAGRGVVNNQFLKDLFQACMMHEVQQLAIAIRNVYRGSNDFERVCLFFDTLYASRRLDLPIEGLLIIGY
jgi:hypothetical protein